MVQDKRMARRLAGMFVAAVLPTVQATPFSVMAGAGLPGSPVSALLVDAGISGLEAAGIRLQFDPGVLAFTGATVGLATADFSLVAGQPTAVLPGLSEVLVSLATNALPVDGVAGGLLEADFDILGNALAGPTTVAFESFDTDYVIPHTAGTIEVLAVNAAPEPGGAALALVALAGMAFFQRRTVRRAWI